MSEYSENILIEKLQREEIPEYPMAALREAHETVKYTAHVPHKHRTCTPQVTGQVTGQVGTKSGLSKDQVKILDKCLHDSQIGELMAPAGRTNRTKFRDQVLNPLLEAGFVEMTVPEKPNSSKQRYRTTAAGRAVLANAEKETRS